jgi:Ca2+-binding EF-hand superfamily protein
MFSGMNMLNTMANNSYYNPLAFNNNPYNFGLNSLNKTNFNSNLSYQNFYNNSYNNYSDIYTRDLGNVSNPYDVEYSDKTHTNIGLTEAERKATDDGETIDKGLQKLNSSDKKFKYAGSDATDEEKKSALLKYSKSYVAFIDTDADDLISEDEFVEHEQESSTSRNDKALRAAYRQFDLNGDGLDASEFAALLRTYDRNNDGTITSEEFKDANRASISGIQYTAKGDEDKDRFRTKLINNYRKLFGDDSI